MRLNLSIQKNFRELHNEYPLAPERLMVNKVEMLIPNLRDETKYVLNYKTLKLYLSVGLKLKTIHRGISFYEEAWMNSYIEKNTNLRAKKDATEFEKDFYKLMNNSAFGKTMENIRTRVDIRLKSNEKSVKKLASKQNYERTTIFDANLVAVHMKKNKTCFQQTSLSWVGILDISKTLMYDFHCNYMKKKYDCKLLMTDTDGFMHEIET